MVNDKRLACGRAHDTQQAQGSGENELHRCEEGGESKEEPGRSDREAVDAFFQAHGALRPLLRRRSTIKLLYGPGIASPGLALSQDIVHMGGLYNILTDTEPPRARPGPSRPSSSSGGPPAAARCGGVTNPTTEHRDAVGRSEAQVDSLQLLLLN